MLTLVTGGSGSGKSAFAEDEGAFFRGCTEDLHSDHAPF